MDKKMLVKNNAFITAKYNLTLDENRLFVYVLYNLQKNKTELSCEINRSDFAKIFKHRTKTTVKGITEVLESLKKKSIYFKEKLPDGSINWGSYVFVMGIIYNDKSDTFNIKVPQKVYDLLMQYMDGYTPIALQIWLGLKNTHSQRFYDLLRMWSGTKHIINYRVEDLKEYLQIENKYPNFNDFKKRVIIPAIEELNSTGYFEIEFKENKIGRKIDSIDFYVKDLDKRKYFSEEIIEPLLNNKIKIEKPTEEPKIEYENNLLEAPVSDLFIPDDTLFTKGTLRSFKLDFAQIDFKNKYMEKAFNDAIMITFDRDDVDTIKATSYKFFKGTLDNKIIEYKIEEKEDIEHKKNIEMFW